MRACTSCGSANPPGFRFCGACGIELAAGGCPACGFANPAGQHFCGRCGGALEALPVSIEPERGERRLATVLFADAVGFTALAEASDPEALAGTVDAALRRMTEVVVAHGGTIDKYIGDALMALFGVPIAHGDDAERAVAAALQMRDAGGDLRFSIGINSGDVMVTTVGERGAVTVIGDAVNVASRLESAAGAGEILVGPLTAELIADRFQLRERAPTVLRGKSEPIAVYEVVGRRADTVPADAAPPLVGRDAELSFLRSRWQRATERSRAQVVVLTGDAGVGKTRLAAEVAARVVDESSVVEATCPGYGALVGSRISLELTRQLEDGSTVDDQDGDQQAAPGFDDRGVWRLRRLIASRSAERPLLVVIDDVHNATDADLDPLVQLTARIADLPVTVLLAGRPQPGGWLSRFATASTLHLDPLSPPDAATLATLIAGDPPLDADAATRLAAQADGNPLHLRELVRLLGSHGDLVPRSGRLQLDDRPALPHTLHAVLAARLDALGPGDKAVLQDVAIFSDGATAAEIQALAGSDPQPSLDRLVNAGLIRRRDSRYEVGDPLLREVAYEQLPHAHRAVRHRRAAAVATTSQGRARHLGQAARFLPGDPALRAEAATALAGTGLELLDQNRLRDGIQLLRRAIELGHADATSLLRVAEAENNLGRNDAWVIGLLDRIDTAGDPHLAAAVMQARGNALRHIDLERSMAVLTEAGERWSALGDPGKRAWALTNRGMTLFDAGRIDEAAADHEVALELFRANGDRNGAAAAGQALALEHPDDPRVPAWLEDGLSLAEETGDLAQRRNALIPLAWSRFIRGHLGGPTYADVAREDAALLIAVSVEMGDASFEAQGHSMIAVLERLAGRIASAEDHLARARHALTDAGAYAAPLVEATALMVRLARNPDGPTGPIPASEPGPIGLVSETLVIEGLVVAGHIDSAIAHVASSPFFGQPAPTPFFARLVGVARGAVMVLAGHADDARETLVSARDTARAIGAHPTAVTASALIAEIDLGAGRADAARAQLAEVGDDPGGVAGLLCERVRWLLGDPAAGERLISGAAALMVPGLAVRKPGAATDGQSSSASTK